MKKTYLFLFIILCVSCTGSSRVCEAFQVEKALFIPMQETVSYYNQFDASLELITVRKQINQGGSFSGDCDCECLSYCILELESREAYPLKINYFMEYTDPVSKDVKQIRTTLQYDSHTYYFDYASDLSNISVPLIENIELNAVVYSDVIRLEDEKYEIYLASDVGIVQITNKTTNEIWSL